MILLLALACKPAALTAAEALPPDADPGAVVAAFRPLVPLADPVDTQRLSTALCTLGDADDDAIEAASWYTEGNALGGCSAEQVRHAETNRARADAETAANEAAAARQKAADDKVARLAAVADARLHLAAGQAEKVPEEALIQYEAAINQTQAAVNLGATEKDVGAIRAAAVKGKSSAKCAADGLARQDLYAPLLQDNFYKNGLDISVSVHGKCNTTLRLYYTLWSNPAIYQMRDGGDLDRTLRGYGFEHVEAPSYDQTWSWDL